MSLSSSTNLIGHEAQREFLTRQACSHRLSAATMLVGPSGIGKVLVAKELAATLLCEKYSMGEPSQGGCTQCKSCVLLRGGSHPDAHFLNCADSNLSSIENFRALLYTLHLNPFAQSSRVIILENAEFLSVQVSNLLLKILEEPRPNTFFVLTTANHSKLPATLLSRCQIWFFEKLSNEEMASALSRNSLLEGFLALSDAQRTDLFALCDGSLESLALVKDEIEEWQHAQEVLEKIFRGDVFESALYAATLAKNKEKLRNNFRYMRVWGRKRLRDTIRSGSAKKSPVAHRLALFVQNVIEAERLVLERNLAPLSVLTLILSDLADSDEFTRTLHSDRLLNRLAL